MILTCPECATSYFVDDSRIPPGGRTVKCTSCDARWRAEPDGVAAAAEPVAPASEPEVEAAPEPVAEVAAEPPPATAAAPPPADDLEFAPREDRPRRRPPPPQPAARKGALGAVVAWSVMAATVAALVAGAIVFREQVVKLLPQSSGAYAGVGLPVNQLGLVIEQVKVEPAFQGGRPVLSVSGAVRNVADHTAEAPALRIDLLDKEGEPVAAKIARPIDARIPAGAKRYFAIAIIDPPASAKDLQVAFETAGGPAPAAHTAEAGAHAPVPEAVEAQPLPADAPEALHDHG